MKQPAMFHLDDRVALVNGAGRGMGLGVARALGTQGARVVVVNDFYAERAEEAAAALCGEGINACTGAGDITQPAVSLGMMNNFGCEDKSSAVGRTGTPEDVSAAVAHLTSTEVGWMTGQVLPLNGGAITA